MHYQAAKVFKDPRTGIETSGWSWREAKGKHAANQEDVAALYSKLWDQYIDNHPELLAILKGASGLSDIFGQAGRVCQATELWRIRNSR